jgi:hypothetical protein
MQETAVQYRDRLLGYLDGKDPVKVQSQTADRLARLIRGVSRARLTRRLAPKKWSVGEIIAHLADDELVGGYRMRVILEKPGTPIQGFDQDKWAQLGNYAKRDPKASLEFFRAARKANLAFYRSLNPRQRKFHGVHSERGPESIELVFKLFAAHDLNHLRQIEAILGKQKTM